MTLWITCREFVEFLDSYLSGELAGERLAEFNNHLAGCPPCVTYMHTYQEAVRLGRDALRGMEGPVPDEVPDRLVAAILAARVKPES